jgi:hypothetical protein
VDTEETKGSRALAALTQGWGEAGKMAKKLGIGADRISVWSRGKGKPDTKHRIKLLQFGIGLTDWDELANEPEVSNGPEAA